jgi:sulfatase maturation enzyme AslB (radical SAM superfamily)
MKFSQLAFIVTDACNYRCTYCPQTHKNKYMKSGTIEKALSFFYPYLADDAYIVFFGGEPMLAMDTIRQAVGIVEGLEQEGKKNIHYSLTTNGSLVTDETLEFFDRHRFKVLLSFDGLAQDVSRKAGSIEQVTEVIVKMQTGGYPDIDFSTNSVFAPETVGLLSDSLKYIMDTGIDEMEFNIASDTVWDDPGMDILDSQLDRFTDILAGHYHRTGKIPVSNYAGAMFSPDDMKKKESHCFTCGAGTQRIAITPEEQVWGCSVFHDYLKYRKNDPDYDTYSFGQLEDFIKKHESLYPRVSANYAPLRQDCFFTEKSSCFTCKELNSCSSCPVNAAYVTDFIGKLPPWMCRLNSIQNGHKRRFREKIQKVKAA